MEDKFDTFVETSDNRDDLLIYSMNGVDSNFISDFDPLVVNSQFGILIKNNSSKINHLNVILDSNDQHSDSLILYLLKTFGANVKSINVSIVGENVYKSRLSQILSISVTVQEYDPEKELNGLVLKGLNIGTLADDIEQSKHCDYDLLLLKEL
ncbi:hypothetical protein WICANDRAFT_98048 [Wickerhamomyces anomalus NRRL Y-366-8]|uniref:Uncharacterized protein n=1 Tax=Wickerhamomyces anomalus (strain ATCC 58044 / CBS 1984 / NCYC 433 / NRRL Y-366-8) TaxID=683960 RepID=A0A1E3NUB6_WICAA|nr:uncharacterized protein WICANDRAFT_98048 [Wickerhamomyces anomalus NRRL Y-366-8]ODQ56716.1 hypothetical protein WICANDRAFT_98048 [Wickerhamomyces anomalus NRRL Y-366-8]